MTERGWGAKREASEGDDETQICEEDDGGRHGSMHSTLGVTAPTHLIILCKVYNDFIFVLLNLRIDHT